jgi:hypothetical protein
MKLRDDTDRSSVGVFVLWSHAADAGPPVEASPYVLDFGMK